MSYIPWFDEGSMVDIMSKWEAGGNVRMCCKQWMGVVDREGLYDSVTTRGGPQMEMPRVVQM